MKKCQKVITKLVIVGVFFIWNISVSYAQNFDFNSNKGCHVENSKILINIIETSLGEKCMSKLIKKSKKDSFYNFNIGRYNDIFKLYVDFDKEGNIIEIGFVRNTDGKLSRRQRKKIIRFFEENTNQLSICWDDLSTIDNFSDEERDRYANFFEKKMNSGEVSYYRMNIHFPGYITQGFFDKYIKDLR